MSNRKYQVINKGKNAYSLINDSYELSEANKGYVQLSQKLNALTDGEIYALTTAFDINNLTDVQTLADILSVDLFSDKTSSVKEAKYPSWSSSLIDLLGVENRNFNKVFDSDELVRRVKKIDSPYFFRSIDDHNAYTLAKYLGVDESEINFKSNLSYHYEVSSLEQLMEEINNSFCAKIEIIKKVTDEINSKIDRNEKIIRQLQSQINSIRKSPINNYNKSYSQLPIYSKSDEEELVNSSIRNFNDSNLIFKRTDYETNCTGSICFT